MLILFLRMCLHCGLLHCSEENENLKDSFLDYSITEMWWNGTPGIEQTGRNTVQYSFMPTPPGHGQFPSPDDDGVFDPPDPPDPPEQPEISSEELKTFTPFPDITRPSYPFDVEDHTVVAASLSPLPPPLPPNWHINFPGLTPPPNFPSDYRYPTVFPTIEQPYSPSPTGPTPKGPSFTLPYVSRPEFTYPTLYPTNKPASPAHEPAGSSWGPATSTPARAVPHVSWNPAEAYVRLWQEQLSSHAAPASAPPDAVPKLPLIFDYDLTKSAERFPMELRRIPNTRQRKLNDKQPVDFQEVTAHAAASKADPESEDKLSPYDPDSHAAERIKHTQTLKDATVLTQDSAPLNVTAVRIREDNTDDGDGDSINNTTQRH